MYVTKSKKTQIKKILVERYKKIPIYLKEDMFHVSIPGGMSFGCEMIKDAREHVDDHFQEAEQIAEKERKAKEAEAKNRKLMKTACQFKAHAFKEFFYKLSRYTSEARLKYKTGQLTSLEMDPANVAMIECKLKSIKRHKQNFEIVINSCKINTFLRDLHFTSKDKIEMFFSYSESGNKRISLKSKYGIYSTDIIEIDDNEKGHKKPELKDGLKAKFRMDTETFYELIDTAGKIGESVSFELESGKLTISAKDNDNNHEWKYTMPRKIKGHDCKSRFSTEYLKQEFICGKTVTLQLGTDFPLKLTDTNSDIMILAPRVESD